MEQECSQSPPKYSDIIARQEYNQEKSLGGEVRPPKYFASDIVTSPARATIFNRKNQRRIIVISLLILLAVICLCLTIAYKLNKSDRDKPIETDIKVEPKQVDKVVDPQVPKMDDERPPSSHNTSNNSNHTTTTGGGSASSQGNTENHSSTTSQAVDNSTQCTSSQSSPAPPVANPDPKEKDPDEQSNDQIPTPQSIKEVNTECEECPKVEAIIVEQPPKYILSDADFSNNRVNNCGDGYWRLPIWPPLELLNTPLLSNKPFLSRTNFDLCQKYEQYRIPDYVGSLHKVAAEEALSIKVKAVESLGEALSYLQDNCYPSFAQSREVSRFKDDQNKAGIFLVHHVTFSGHTFEMSSANVSSSHDTHVYEDFRHALSTESATNFVDTYGHGFIQRSNIGGQLVFIDFFDHAMGKDEVEILQSCAELNWRHQFYGLSDPVAFFTKHRCYSLHDFTSGKPAFFTPILPFTNILSLRNGQPTGKMSAFCPKSWLIEVETQPILFGARFESTFDRMVKVLETLPELQLFTALPIMLSKHNQQTLAYINNLELANGLQRMLLASPYANAFSKYLTNVADPNGFQALSVNCISTHIHVFQSFKAIVHSNEIVMQAPIQDLPKCFTKEVSQFSVFDSSTVLGESAGRNFTYLMVTTLEKELPYLKLRRTRIKTCEMHFRKIHSHSSLVDLQLTFHPIQPLPYLGSTFQTQLVSEFNSRLPVINIIDTPHQCHKCRIFSRSHEFDYGDDLTFFKKNDGSITGIEFLGKLHTPYTYSMERAGNNQSNSKVCISVNDLIAFSVHHGQIRPSGCFKEVVKLTAIKCTGK